MASRRGGRVQAGLRLPRVTAQPGGGQHTQGLPPAHLAGHRDQDVQEALQALVAVQPVLAQERARPEAQRHRSRAVHDGQKLAPASTSDLSPKPAVPGLGAYVHGEAMGWGQQRVLQKRSRRACVTLRYEQGPASVSEENGSLSLPLANAHTCAQPCALESQACNTYAPGGYRVLQTLVRPQAVQCSAGSSGLDGRVPAPGRRLVPVHSKEFLPAEECGEIGREQALQDAAGARTRCLDGHVLPL